MNPRHLLIETTAYLAPAKTLEGLTSADAERHVEGAHSIAEIVAHMAFWQAWLTGRALGSGEAMAASAGIGWPAVELDSWPEIHRRFLDGLESAAALDISRPGPIHPPIEFPPMAGYAAADIVVHIAQHNAHHLGQVILLRQCMKLWPPPAGSWTW